MAFSSGKNAASCPRRKSSRNFSNFNDFCKQNSERWQNRTESKKLWGFSEEERSWSKGGSRRRSKKNLENPSSKTKGGLTMESVTILKRGEKIEDVIAAKCSNLTLEDRPGVDFEDVKYISPSTKKIGNDDPGSDFKKRMNKSFSRRSKVCPLTFEDQGGGDEQFDERYQFKDIDCQEVEAYKGCYKDEGNFAENSKHGFKKNDFNSLHRRPSSYEHTDMYQGGGPFLAEPPSPKALPLPKFSTTRKKIINFDYSDFDSNESESGMAPGSIESPENPNQNDSSATRYITDPFGVDVFASLDLRKVLNI
eukprot:TRINITY_DN1746_c0_g1_i1.p1 TRINITY_DN1746_c0_g1~~TRINITY_DN1746_c0_g1_i1.p1  ORF type:complete len:308 (-),score=45.26 TRINITY_DN1746_c0_g1_i1:725-1648(-)